MNKKRCSDSADSDVWIDEIGRSAFGIVPGSEVQTASAKSYRTVQHLAVADPAGRDSVHVRTKVVRAPNVNAVANVHFEDAAKYRQHWMLVLCNTLSVRQRQQQQLVLAEVQPRKTVKNRPVVEVVVDSCLVVDSRLQPRPQQQLVVVALAQNAA